MTKVLDSHKRFAFPIQVLSDDRKVFAELPSEIHIIPTGDWQHPVYGRMIITSEDITRFKKNFDAGVRKDIRITAGHDNGMSGGELPAIAWITSVIDRGMAGLFATVEWTPEGKRLLEERAFKYFSPEFYEEYRDPETGEEYRHVLVGGALTNMPYFKELKDVVSFSENSITKQLFNDTKSMDLKDIRVMKASELNDEQKAFLIANKSQLTDAELETFKEIVGAKPATAAAPAPATFQVPEGMKLVTASEHDQLKADAAKGVEAMQKIQASERKEFVASLMFSEANKAGRFVPAQEEALKAFTETLSDAQRTMFAELVKGIKVTTAELFSEIGDGGDPEPEKKASEQVISKVKEKIAASDGKLSHARALSEVMAENPELAKAYDAEMGGGDED